MLVLSRRVGEKIVIGNEVVIEVLAAGGDTLRLGITAPRETSVHRHEVFAEIQASNEAASAASAALSHTALARLAARLRSKDEAQDAASAAATPNSTSATS